MSRITYSFIDAHTFENPRRVITSGSPKLIINTMSKKRQHFLKEFQVL